jgi:hypothetical protein
MCADEATGGITPYKYILNGGELQTGNSFKNLKAGTYNITVQDSRGCTLSMGDIQITAPSVSCGANASRPFSISSNDKNKLAFNEDVQISVAPNPSATNFNVSLSSFINQIEIRVSDSQGKMMYKAIKSGKNTFTFGEDLPPGFYVLQLMYNKEIKTVKLVKQ